MKIPAIALVFICLSKSSLLGGVDSEIPKANQVILASGAFIPTAEETQKALVSVQAYLEKPTPGGDVRSKGEIKNVLANAKNYRVQFVGVIRQKKRFVWCNFFPSAAVRPHDFDYWKHKVVEVEDGRYWYWQIDYDPATGKCMHLWVNGVA